MGEKNEKVPHICPWYMAYLFDNPLRSLVHDPEKILGKYIKPGMTVLDIGCGMGFFSLGMAKLVGTEGQVISLDLQEQMLRILMKRARRRGLADRIDGRIVKEGAIPVDKPADFALCFWMVHEIPARELFFRGLARVLKPRSMVFIAEPGMHHVTPEDLEKTVLIAADEGFLVADRPKVRLSHAVVLQKTSIN